MSYHSQQYTNQPQTPIYLDHVCQSRHQAQLYFVYTATIVSEPYIEPDGTRLLCPRTFVMNRASTRNLNLATVSEVGRSRLQEVEWLSGNGVIELFCVLSKIAPYSNNAPSCACKIGDHHDVGSCLEQRSRSVEREI